MWNLGSFVSLKKESIKWCFAYTNIHTHTHAIKDILRRKMLCNKFSKSTRNAGCKIRLEIFISFISRVLRSSFYILHFSKLSIYFFITELYVQTTISNKIIKLFICFYQQLVVVVLFIFYTLYELIELFVRTCFRILL